MEGRGSTASGFRASRGADRRNAARAGRAPGGVAGIAELDGQEVQAGGIAADRHQERAAPDIPGGSGPGFGRARLSVQTGVSRSLPRFHNARRRLRLRRMVKTQFMPEGSPSPVQKDDQGNDLDGPKFDAVNNSMRIKTLSTHTISYPAVEIGDSKKLSVSTRPNRRALLLALQV